MILFNFEKEKRKIPSSFRLVYCHRLSGAEIRATTPLSVPPHSRLPTTYQGRSGANYLRKPPLPRSLAHNPLPLFSLFLPLFLLLPPLVIFILQLFLQSVFGCGEKVENTINLRFFFCDCLTNYRLYHSSPPRGQRFIGLTRAPTTRRPAGRSWASALPTVRGSIGLKLHPQQQTPKVAIS